MKIAIGRVASMSSIKYSLVEIEKRLFKGIIYGYYTCHLKYRGKAYQLNNDLYFPPHTSCNKKIRIGSEGELLAIGGDLSPERIMLAYQNGIYLFSLKNEPYLWWTSETHCVMPLKNFHIRRDVRNFVHHEVFQLTMDQAYYEVVEACSEFREDYTWLTPERKRAAYELFERGNSHSVEVWQNDRMIGGLYGVSWDKNFYPESMFTRQNNGSKVAMTALALRLKEKKFVMLDFGIWPTDNLKRFGAVMIDRNDYLKQLETDAHGKDAGLDWPALFENWDLKSAVEMHLVEEHQHEYKKIAEPSLSF
jgi:leucyl/phenylalanyl-tRNA--protein transferase